MPDEITLSTYELHYFPIHALGATSRAILSIAGADWEDRIQSFETWKTDKELTPFGSLPILTVHDTITTHTDGDNAIAKTTTKRIPEADVIERFLAKRLGFLGSNPEEELEICIALSQTITIHNVWVFRVVPASAMGSEVREKILKAFLEVTLRNWILNCEKQLRANSKGSYLVGEKVSLADIKTAVLMDMFLAVQGVETYLNEQIAPGLWRLKEAIDTSPGYREYRRSEAFREQDAMTSKKVSHNWKGLITPDLTSLFEHKI
ncbi:hypothetical protein BG015_008679 [Linnemannia schmuckeri]|uniref:GST N-terminal domain-containing protein n=1 Tax=Linnemannia schmuckeri TaxID=64567 RepID=A0A9P5RWZ9_9FUNG|nr:hypothetical protein BG015_008679 [Linnemannia schmuckeri]